MSGPTLLVTVPTTPEHRRTIADELPSEVTCLYLDEIETQDRPEAVDRADGLLSRVPQEELDDAAFERVRSGQVMQILTSGIDHLPLDQFPEDLVLQSNAGAYSEPIAEHALAMVCALSKRLRIEHTKLQDGEFDQFRPNHRIDGMVCGIFGYGGIGQETGRLLKQVGATVMGITRSGEAAESAAFVGTPDDLEYVLERANVLIVTAPLTDATRGIIDKDALEQMPDDGMIVNVARGEIIDQDDLYDHLTENPTFQAGIDAWWIEPVRHGRFELEYPFLDLPNVIGSPHNAGQIPDIRNEGLKAAIRHVTAALIDDEYTNVVNRERGY